MTADAPHDRAAPTRFRRIVVAIDPSADHRAALAEATRLARQLEAELSALFVEDTGMLGASALPFVRSFGLSAGGWRSFERGEMETAVRALAEQARQTLAELAGRDQLRWSFRVVRGEVEDEALQAAAETDLVVLGAGHDRFHVAARSPSLARVRVTSAGRSVLFMRPDAAARERITVAFDGSPGAERALEAAVGLAGAANVTVLLTPPMPDGEAELERRARAVLGAGAEVAAFVRLPGASAADLCGASSTAGAGALVLGSDNPLLQDDAGLRRLDETDCRVLVVR